MDEIACEVYRTIDRLLPATAALPREVLGAAARMALSGQVFQEAGPLVLAVAQALREQPALFAEVGIDGAELRGRQERASAYQALAACLRVLEERATCAYLRTQAEATLDAMDVVRHVRGGAASRFAGTAARHRADALLPAEAILAARHRRKRRRLRPRGAETGAAARGGELDPRAGGA